ncbi:MAG: hypothetical protein Q9178_002542 [Gyalolechia marmorata]
MEHSTSSKKVTVEYTDPSGIFPVISEDLQKHLPLRNLYWNSATRPLRSISSLHIELVQAGSPNTSSDISEHVNHISLNGGAENVEDREVSRNNRPGSAVGATKERRHQIPGLRQTPYLKIFFLRCSDVESYRVTYRKQIREWIKGIKPPTQSTASVNTQEFHDAFEWLIVHVVLPDDGRSISRASALNKSEIRSSLGGSSAVTDKIRADFSGSSKTAIDRVAWVQITRGSHTDQNQTSSDGWEDFITKIKSLILGSFDLRVRQYEEDIKERHVQRNIPGWNFNTFFVLKEGLARGFESVGLVEDALMGYRELALELNSIIEMKDDKEQYRDHFKAFTDDLSATLKSALQTEGPPNLREQKPITTSPTTQPSQAGEHRQMLGANILDADRKPFRELILANEISAFDFRCYLFAREASLLLRLANATGPSDNNESAKAVSPDVTSKLTASTSQDLLLLAEVCQRSSEFISTAGRMIRDDLRSSIHPLSKGHTTASPTMLSIFETPIEDIVASWTYSACQCILDATDVPSLHAQLQPLIHNLRLSVEVPLHPNSSSSTLSREGIPRRTSSLPARAYASQRPPSPDKFPALTSLDAVGVHPSTSSQTGKQELAAQQAELVILKRRITVSVGRRSTSVSIKRASLAGPSSLTGYDMENIPLDNDLSTKDHTEKSHGDSHGSAANIIQCKELSQSLRSESTFNEAYEELTTKALALSMLGGRRRTADSLTTDLAAIRFRLQDYSSAVSYFHQLASFYCNNDWTRLELPMLDMYAKCLQHLDRRQDFCLAGLQILAKTASRQRLLDAHAETTFHHSPVDIDRYLQDVITVSGSLERPVSTPLRLHFDDVNLNPYIRHCHKKDGFRMLLKFRNIMSAAVEAQDIRVKLINTDDEQHCDIWLTTEGPELLQPGISNITVQTAIRSANILFTWDAIAPTNSTSFDIPSTSDGVPQYSLTPILVWPDQKSLEARLSHCKSIHLGKLRSIEIAILTGRNKISQGKIGVRACSAGLRLHTADAQIVSGDCLILRRPQAGSLEFGALDAQSKTTFRVPYGIEGDLPEIKVRVEITYTVEGREYQYNCTGELPIRLPLSVNVQDSYHERMLFSNFKIDTANSIPMRVGDYTLHSTDAFHVNLPPLGSDPLTIFAHQPLSLVARVRQSRPRTTNAWTSLPPDRMLMLRIQYACLDQEITTAVEDTLSRALVGTEFDDLSRMLLTGLHKLLRSQLSSQDFETIGLLGEVQLSSLGQHLWQSVLNGLQPERRNRVAHWLAKWQAVCTLPESEPPSTDDVLGNFYDYSSSNNRLSQRA